MIYIDTSVVLATVLAEAKTVPESVWRETLVSSRLCQYECWVRVNANNLHKSHGELLRACLDRIAFVELSEPVLTRAMEPFPVLARTLDALHLSTMDYLRSLGRDVELLTFDERLRAAARKLKIGVMDA